MIPSFLSFSLVHLNKPASFNGFNFDASINTQQASSLSRRPWASPQHPTQLFRRETFSTTLSKTRPSQSRLFDVTSTSKVGGLRSQIHVDGRSIIHVIYTFSVNVESTLPQLKFLFGYRSVRCACDNAGLGQPIKAYPAS